ncbi:MAG TPA: hypothetical protein VF868_14140 [Bacteroidia bacterium]|jgi:hypothetical protein
MRIVNYLLVLAFYGTVSRAYAQEQDDYFKPQKAYKLKGRMSASVTAGTGVSFINNSRSLASTFIAPKLNYKVNEKLSLTGGLIHYSFAPGNSFSIRNERSANSRNYQGNILFAGGEYNLNKRVLLSGAVLTNADANPENNFKAASFGVDYKLTGRSTIGFRATVSQGSADYLSDPGNNSYNYRPFNNSILGNTPGEFGQWGIDGLNRTTR